MQLDPIDTINNLIQEVKQSAARQTQTFKVKTTASDGAKKLFNEAYGRDIPSDGNLVLASKTAKDPEGVTFMPLENISANRQDEDFAKALDKDYTDLRKNVPLGAAILDKLNVKVKIIGKDSRSNGTVALPDQGGGFFINRIIEDAQGNLRESAFHTRMTRGGVAKTLKLKGYDNRTIQKLLGHPIFRYYLSQNRAWQSENVLNATNPAREKNYFRKMSRPAKLRAKISNLVKSGKAPATSKEDLIKKLADGAEKRVAKIDFAENKDLASLI